VAPEILFEQGAVRRRQLGEQGAVNMNTMGTSFVGKVKDVRQIAKAQIGKEMADVVGFQAQASGHEATEKAGRIQAWQHLSDWQLTNKSPFQGDRFPFQGDGPVLLLPGSWWSGQHKPKFESAGWWQKPTRRAWCK